VTQAWIWLYVRSQEKKMLVYARASSVEDKKKEMKKTKAVAIQSTYYVVAFISCWIGPTLFHIVRWATGFTHFSVAFIITILTPLQGFWNCLIFARPTYVGLRKKYPELSRMDVFKSIFFHPDPGGCCRALCASKTSAETCQNEECQPDRDFEEILMENIVDKDEED
jgi:hypothetical protein